MIFEKPPVRMGRDVAPTMNMMAVSGPPSVPLRLRDVFVTAFAGTLSWSVNSWAMKACLVGTSICEMLCLRNRNVTAPKNEPASGTMMRKTFDNKCVDTIVLRLPRSGQSRESGDYVYRQKDCSKTRKRYSVDLAEPV